MRLRSVGTAILLALSLRSPVPAAGPETPVAFPLRVSDDGRYLVGRNGRPFFYNADTAWMLFLRLTRDEAAEYLADRKAKGFNAVQVQLTGFLGDKDRGGHEPFQGGHDFSRPNEDYFAHVDEVAKQAESLGLVLAVAPLWSGCCGEGWAGRDGDGRPKPIDANGPEKCEAFGRWLGERYRSSPNVIWILGGDNDPGPSREAIDRLARGLKASAPDHLVTFHAASTHSSTDVWPDAGWLDVSMTYTYFRGFDKAWNRQQPDVYEVGYAEHAKTPPKPFFLGESTYEGEHGDWGSPLQVRKQAYWAILSGACGHAYGSVNWRLPDDWRANLDLPGAASLLHFRRLFESRPWHTLRPDPDGRLVAGGRGPNDAAVGAVAADGRFAVAYLPSRRAVTVDMTRLAGDRVTAWWFDPATGEASQIGEFATDGRRDFAPAADGDRVLVLDSTTAGFPPPGDVRLDFDR